MADPYIPGYTYARHYIAKVAYYCVVPNCSIKIQQATLANTNIIGDHHTRHDGTTVSNFILKMPDPCKWRNNCFQYAPMLYHQLTKIFPGICSSNSKCKVRIIFKM